jgi:hypothetical protein
LFVIFQNFADIVAIHIRVYILKINRFIWLSIQLIQQLQHIWIGGPVIAIRKDKLAYREYTE